MTEETGSNPETKWSEFMNGAPQKTVERGREVMVKRAGKLYIELLEAGYSFSDALGLIYAKGASDAYKTVRRKKSLRQK